ncbi:MAG: DUF4386 domain-containing protein [Thermoplasmata archaeon]|nr:MAG: DUF4386 domain-containing protein [Thermoplasmata archaeon]
MVEGEKKMEPENEKEKKKDYYRQTAIIVGLLFITATAVTIVGIVFMGSSLEDDPVDLVKVVDNETGIIIAGICWIILAISVAGIGFFMHPILKKYHEGLSLGYVSFRLMETVLILVSVISLQSLLTLSQEFVAGDLNAADYEPSVILLKALFDWSFIIGTMIFLGLGGLVLNFILFKLKLVPSWLSIWGFIGGACVLLYGLISLFGHDPAILAAPLAVQEMVFAVWLIAKGFNPPVTTSNSEKTDVN